LYLLYGILLELIYYFQIIIFFKFVQFFFPTERFIFLDKFLRLKLYVASLQQNILYSKSIKETKNSKYVYYNEFSLLENIWTVLPTLLLFFIVCPSLITLTDTSPGYSCNQFTVKVIGNQWYWNYSVSSDVVLGKYVGLGLIQKSFDSNLIPTNMLFPGEFRLLEVDNKLILPKNTPIRFIVTSTDVLHSWAIPSLGVKVDACPGRMNVFVIYIYRNSIFYGQCSEICGILHGFMPVVIQTVDYLDYLKKSVLF